MVARNIAQEHLEKALAIVNEKYQGNISFRHLDREGKGFRFALRVKSTKGRGTRYGQSGLMGYGIKKRIASACWHVHGDFFDALFGINQDATIKSRNTLITAYQNNWQDFNIGSIMCPVYASQACVCN